MTGVSRSATDKPALVPADARRSVGEQGEEQAAAYLTQLGYTILARNWRTRTGELDIVARDGECLVFVEVRTRRVGRYTAAPALGAPEESVTPRKQLQLVAMADEYLFQIPWDGPKRIDVVAVELGTDGALHRLTHYRDAVEGMA
ncbi:MAG: YraN family protein [Anaerolineae bacterium]|nr:YraN family protein [Anaerolineae bacterium]